jgi:hypothetical protein
VRQETLSDVVARMGARFNEPLIEVRPLTRNLDGPRPQFVGALRLTRDGARQRVGAAE